MMLVEIADTVVSTELFERKFVCDLQACRGACCIEGDSGAPLQLEEIDLIEDNLEEILPFLREEGVEAINRDGVFYMDQENEPVTSLVGGKECAFVVYDQNGITKCGIEQAYVAGKSAFRKPISCHLYPIRIKQFHEKKALVFDKWSICEPACACGDRLEVPVYRFLRDAIVRTYGEAYFDELHEVAEAWKNKKDH